MLVCGLPGTGKTSISIELAKLTNWLALSTDKIKKELISNPIYSVEEKRLIYDVLVLIAKYLYQSGTNCILDASCNTKYEQRVTKHKCCQNNKSHIKDGHREQQKIECLTCSPAP